MDVRQLYTERIDTYLSFNSFFRSAQALQALFQSYDLLRSDLRILDAGCGTGTASLALLSALSRRKLDYQAMHAFDLTPAMLVRFRQQLTQHHISNVQLREANVLELETLPPSWTNYDLILSVAMLEYVPRAAFLTALSSLRTRLARQGRLLLFITRKNWITKVLIERWWKANRYTREELREAFLSAGFSDVTFRRFPYTYFCRILGHMLLRAGLSSAGQTANAASRLTLAIKLKRQRKHAMLTPELREVARAFCRMKERLQTGR